MESEATCSMLMVHVNNNSKCILVEIKWAHEHRISRIPTFDVLFNVQANKNKYERPKLWKAKKGIAAKKCIYGKTRADSKLNDSLLKFSLFLV